MAKSRDSEYATGARGRAWLKIKHVKTLDLVILAAEWGSGRRKGWLSNLHLGARDTEKGGFAMLGKTFKGLTDEMLEWQTQELLKIEIERDSYTVHVEPKIVAEIAFNDLQVSPRYVSGLALRFARVKRYRTDKTAAESDTFQTVKRIAEIGALLIGLTVRSQRPSSPRNHLEQEGERTPKLREARRSGESSTPQRSKRDYSPHKDERPIGARK